MIYLDPGTSSRVDIQLVYSGLTPSFSWKLEKKETKELYYFYADTFCNCCPYYMSFTLSTLPGSATAGYLNVLGGEYKYWVYEQNTPYYLTPSNKVSALGLMVIGDTYSNIISNTSSNNQTIKTFNSF